MYLKPETLKLLEENIGSAPRDKGKEKDFLRLIILCRNALSECTTLCQKWASDPTRDGCEPLFCWELISGPLGEQPML